MVRRFAIAPLTTPHRWSNERERIRIVKCSLMAIVVFASLNGVAYSQGSPPTAADQPVNRGTAILESLGIDPGQTVPMQTPPHAEAEHTQVRPVKDPPVKQ